MRIAPPTWVFSTALALVGLGCATPEPTVEPIRRPPPPAEGQPQPQAEPAPDSGRLSQADARSITDRLIAQVAQARGLEVKHEVEVEVVDKPGIRAFVLNALYEDQTKEEVALLGRIEAAFGVIAEGSDAEQILLDLYEDGVLGIYDDKTDTLLIGNFISPMMMDMVVGHEIAHGLQDMHFDLTALHTVHKGETDRDSARTFLVEGDAQASYLTWRAGDRGLSGVSIGELEALADLTLTVDDSMIPHATLARGMQLPYTDGTQAIITLAQSDGWEAVDALYDELPETTEQMLHPDKLRAREMPRELEFDQDKARAALPDHRQVWSDDWGEAGLLNLLADVERPKAARRGAAGWDGDRFIAFDAESPAKVPLVMGVAAWDSVRDAQEFAESFEKYLERRKPGRCVIVRKRDLVYYATGIPEGVDPLPLKKALPKVFSAGSRKVRPSQEGTP